MRKPENWLLGAALVVFVVFFANVTIGAAGFEVFLSDPTEMMTLLAACILFVAATVRCEIRESQETRR